MDLVVVNIPYLFTNNPPMAGAVLKSCVEKAGFTATSLDYNIKFIKSAVRTDDLVTWFQKEDSYPKYSNFLKFKDWVKDCAKDILSHNARWIGISVFTKDSQLAAEEFIIALKELDPNCKIVLGGTGTEDLRSQWQKRWYELMWESDIVDSVILREGEAEIVNLLRENYNQVVAAPQLVVEQLNAVPVPNFDDYNMADYGVTSMDGVVIPITASKGCVRKCTFCNVEAFWPMFRHREGKIVANEIIQLYKKYDIKNFKFTDSLINGSLKDFRAMNQEIVEKLPNVINYRGQYICRPQRQMPDHDYELMRTAGCSNVQIGIESGSERVRQHMKKKFSNADIDHSTARLAEMGINQQWFIFVGYPIEEQDDFNDTLALIEKWAHLQKENLINVIPTGVFQMLDGTPITRPDMIHELGIHVDSSSAYNTYNWTSEKYPSNTFEVRSKRFLEVVALCRKYNLITEYEDFVSMHEKLIMSQI
jgi:radical SAM superfamily enzyme YgiQ (UPF0313 family)